MDDLIQESLDPKALRERFGLPHPLSNFASNGMLKEGSCADAILDFMRDAVWETPDSTKYQAARWFLLESEMTFFFACSEAGIDAEKLRNHLCKCHERYGF
jgi:hypothetical protein